MTDPVESGLRMKLDFISEFHTGSAEGFVPFSVLDDSSEPFALLTVNMQKLLIELLKASAQLIEVSAIPLEH